ncbi:MAG TPA: hypothetical protein VLT62_27085, partial [Candidatus Methylomirabilis sp.]|nr:hypothetical protein [Candidatus Methylomirabilis sp.]
MSAITIPVAPDTARAFEQASAEEQRKLRLLLHKGTRPFFRCQEKFLLSMRSPVRISKSPYIVLPRGRSRENLSRPIVVVP